MRQPPVVAASILSADFARLGEESAGALDARCDWIHLDVMDNHYVPNLTFGAPVCAALRRSLPDTFLDVHLMTAPVDSLIGPFAEAGASALSFHPDAGPHPHRTASAIAEAGMKAGAAFNPATPLAPLPHLLDSIDMVLLMTVNPGFGGQRFIDSSLPKIAEARRMIDACGREVRLQVDGGINPETARLCAEAGADTFVAGSNIFGSQDYKAAVGALREATSPRQAA